MLKLTLAVYSIMALLISMPAARAQQVPTGAVQVPPIKRIPLQKFDVPETKYETVIGIAEIAPNVSIGRHTHPGPESGYVIEGHFELLIEGEAPRQVKAGESYKVPAHTLHDARTDTAGAKVLATYVVEKGLPLALPAK